MQGARDAGEERKHKAHGYRDQWRKYHSLTLCWPCYWKIYIIFFALMKAYRNYILPVLLI